MRMLFTREQLSFKPLWLPLYAQGEWHSRGVQQQVVSPQDEQREPTQHVPQLFLILLLGLVRLLEFPCRAPKFRELLALVAKFALKLSDVTL